MAYFEHIDDEFDFGKYKGLSLSDVMDLNSDYIVWCMLNIAYNGGCMFQISETAMNELSIIYPNFMAFHQFKELNKQQMIFIGESYDEVDNGYCCEGDTETYERYNGSYAQDVMGYSDDEIDTIFDGDPNAYWNID